AGVPARPSAPSGVLLLRTPSDRRDVVAVQYGSGRSAANLLSLLSRHDHLRGYLRRRGRADAFHSCHAESGGHTLLSFLLFDRPLLREEGGAARAASAGEANGIPEENVRYRVRTAGTQSISRREMGHGCLPRSAA